MGAVSSLRHRGMATWDLYQKAASGTAQEELLLKSNEGKFPTDWSWDGRFIAYNRAESRGRAPACGCYRCSAIGSRSRSCSQSLSELFGYFSPNGRWLAYVSDESGKAEVYVRPFPVSPGIWPVSTGGGSQPRWRRDGKELFYLALDGKLMVVEVNAGERFRAGVPKALFQMRLPMDFDWSLETMRSRRTASAFSSPHRREKLLHLPSQSC